MAMQAPTLPLNEVIEQRISAIAALDPESAARAAHALYHEAAEAQETVSNFRKLQAARLNGTIGVGPRRLAVMFGISRSYAQQMIEEGLVMMGQRTA